jgi:hypothetical protein
MTPTQKAEIAGITAGILAATIGIATGDSPGKAIAKGVGTGVATAAVVYYIAKRKATARQQAAARACAQSYRQSISKSSGSSKAKHRYIAVDVPLDARFQGNASVMLWDTKSNTLVNTNVYDLRRSPSPASVATYDQIPAVYVGKGS